jgi:acetyl esterase/lipase
VILDAARRYLQGQDPRTPLASPLYADLRGLPPLLIQVGSIETLLDDAVRLAQRAQAVGVEVLLETWEEVPHIWHCFGSFLPEAQLAIEHVGTFVQQRMGAVGVA